MTRRDAGWQERYPVARAQVWFDAGPMATDPAYTGGSCDEGGPYWVTNYNCAGVGYSQRIDIPEILTWINQPVP